TTRSNPKDILLDHSAKRSVPRRNDKHDIREANVMTLRCTHQVIGPNWRKAMRLLPAIAVLAAVAVMPSSMVFAQNKAAKTDNAAARASRAETRASINDSYNRCVS